jgi:hypothetical protein
MAKHTVKQDIESCFDKLPGTFTNSTVAKATGRFDDAWLEKALEQLVAEGKIYHAFAHGMPVGYCKTGLTVFGVHPEWEARAPLPA